MVTTRSKTAQSNIEDVTTGNCASTSKAPKPTSHEAAPPKANSSRKRKSIETNTEETPALKRTKASSKQSPQQTENKDASKPIMINRAPVLQLWAASVARLTYTCILWETCLSAGSAMSSICAIAKGRSIGTVAEKNDTDKEQVKRDQAQGNETGLDEIEVMHFKLRLKDGLTVVGSDAKGKPGNEDALRKKFGDEEYERVKRVFEEVLESWRGREDELNGRAFTMYEDFRPSVKKGQNGWGKKGELKLEIVRSEVERQ